MGKVIALINTTPDGFVGSEFVIADAEFHEYVHGLLANTQMVAFGRNTFELFQGYGPLSWKAVVPTHHRLKWLKN